MKKYIYVYLMVFLLVFTSTKLVAGSVELTGRAEFNYKINSEFKTSSSNWLASDNAAYLVVKSGSVVLVMDVKYTAPDIVASYVNEFFVPWKVNNNLTIFFGYRNVADYDGFLGNDGSFKWGMNGTGILWYKTVISLIYGVSNFVIDAGTSFSYPLDYVVLFKSNLGAFSLSANVKGKADSSEGMFGIRTGIKTGPFAFYLAGGYNFVSLNISGLLLGIVYNLNPLKASAEVDITNFNAPRFGGYVEYNLVTYRVGVAGNYQLLTGAFYLEPYFSTRLGQAEVKPSLRFNETGFKEFNVMVGFNF